MKLTRQHFEFIARTIASADLPDDERKGLAEHFGIQLSYTNPRFDSARFIAAATDERFRPHFGR